MKRILGWVAALSAILGLVIALRDVFGPAVDKHQDSADTKQAIHVAQTQYENANYAGAVASYQQILAKHPHSQAAIDGRLDAAMARIRNYRQSGESDTDLNAKVDAEMGELIPVLEAGAAAAQRTRFADIEAHLGWANRLRPSGADQGGMYLQKALQTDPGNVYANAMLGLSLAKDSKLSEALMYFQAAVNSGKERPWVRGFQLDALRFNFDPGAPAELGRLLNEMRKNNETLSDIRKHDVLGEFDLADQKELTALLASASPEDTWATFQWVDSGGDADPAAVEFRERRRGFVHASIDEIAGKKQEAVAQFRELDGMRGFAGHYASMTKDALRRLGR